MENIERRDDLIEEDFWVARDLDVDYVLTKNVFAIFQSFEILNLMFAKHLFLLKNLDGVIFQILGLNSAEPADAVNFVLHDCKSLLFVDKSADKLRPVSFSLRVRRGISGPINYVGNV